MKFSKSCPPDERALCKNTGWDRLPGGLLCGEGPVGPGEQREGHGPAVSPGSSDGHQQPGLCEQWQSQRLRRAVSPLHSVPIRAHLDRH